ncbi:MAG TPA: hypothetical protein VJL89_06415 [Thermodesulfovibrionia bacterium]|nr:hypothetical protein [Thermodesulfovibrionia bacterium]
METENLTKKFPVLRSYRDIVMHPFRKKSVTALNNVNLLLTCRATSSYELSG